MTEMRAQHIATAFSMQLSKRCSYGKLVQIDRWLHKGICRHLQAVKDTQKKFHTEVRFQ